MGTTFQERTMTIPEIHPEHKEYWEAASGGNSLSSSANPVANIIIIHVCYARTV